MMRGLSQVFVFLFVVLLLSQAGVARAAQSPEALLDRAKARFETLKLDPAKMQKRRSWSPIIDDLERVTKKYPDNRLAPEARYTLGRVYQELHLYSKNKSDLLKALEAYRSVYSNNPGSSLADDALYQEAVVQWKQFGNAEKARGLTERILSRYPAGDQAKRAQALQASLPRSIANAAAKPLVAAKPAKKEKLKAPTIKTIAIDPGHGGEDPGAIGPRGTQEKDIALQISRRLKAQLEKNLGVKAFLTRDTDVFIPLDERPKIANEKKADLFISIHCNANNNAKMTGVQTYFLDTIKDQYSRKLAARENAVSLEKISDLEMILLDLANRENHELSSKLAGLVHHNMVQGMSRQYRSVNDLGVRTAVFLVLFQAEMPAILVETSFISNKNEEKRLSDPAYQENLAKAITQGVRAYITQGDKIVGTL